MPHHEPIIILQARMGSIRLPGKVLKKLGNCPLLSHCIRRLAKVGKVVVATSDLERDNQIEELAKHEGVSFFRGSEDDVLDRFYQTAKIFKAEVIVRATGDNPFVDPKEAKRVIDTIYENSQTEYVSCLGTSNGESLPIGVGIEAFSIKALAEAWEKGHKPHHREHVNEYILEKSNLFHNIELSCLPENSCPELSLTVDTEKDFAFAQEILAGIPKSALEITTQDIISWWKNNSAKERNYEPQ